MRSRAVRLTLFLLFVIAVGATAYLFWLGETRLRVESETARAYDARVLSIIRDFDQLRASQQAYVAAGQGDQFWANKVTATVADLKSAIEGLRASSTSPDSQAAADNAVAILQDFERMDRRAREYARSGQNLLASDLIFADGRELTTAGGEAILQAGIAERHAKDGTTDGIRRRQLYAIGSGAAAALLVVLLLLPTTRPPEFSQSIAAPGGTRDIAPSPVASLDLGESLDEGWSRPSVVQAASETSSVTEAPAVAQLSSPVVQPTAAAPSVEFGAIASLCTDLARVTDTRALPALLERAATALDASGIVLWIADPDCRELSPILTHGYPASVVTRLGNIVRDAENATAAALRTSLLQTVKTDAESQGAIAAPLLTPTGCVGVMAAEVRHEGERDPVKLAAATIVAAQLATLVGPPSAKARAEATG